MSEDSLSDSGKEDQGVGDLNVETDTGPEPLDPAENRNQNEDTAAEEDSMEESDGELPGNAPDSEAVNPPLPILSSPGGMLQEKLTQQQ
ncbi:hypothetical protein R1flu_001576 [Riccia fluitans]|uniref:Uncharacterized protein n=1 Tax=Riccia fluitans TaxID=41844 RepID=A0ABD1Y3P1_9MARC